MSEKKPVRVRFAPSPTGYLHVGGARSALYNYLFAKKHGGTFVLRVEDTDLERSTEDAMKMQISDLHWLGLEWDEGIDPKTLESQGEYGPYRQSLRLDIYNKYAEQLLTEGKAYYCFLTDEEIDAQREKAKAEGRPPQVDSPYRDWSLEKAKSHKESSPAKPVVRFKTPNQKTDYIINDLVRGEVKFPSDMVGDFVLMRSNGMPVYNFCCAIDDALMKISHVMRAEEHLSNTLRQVMIYEALNFTPPQFGHLSIILGEDRQKLSKRHGATSVNEYTNRGYLPEAMNNFLALLGWSSPKAQEIISMSELIEQFSTDRLNPASAVFDEVKLKWVNATHLRALPHETLWKLLEPLFEKEELRFPEDKQWRDKSLNLMKTSMEFINDGVELFRPLAVGSFTISDKCNEVLSWPSTKGVIGKWKSLVQDSNEMTEEKFTQALDQIKSECEVKGKKLFMPIRVAVIGLPQGAEVKSLVPLISTEELVQRAEKALSSCSG